MSVSLQPVRELGVKVGFVSRVHADKNIAF